LRNAPPAAHDDLLLAWVWSNYRGAISHESALALYDLSDVMPSRVHITVPPTFRRRSANFDVHFSIVPADDLMMYEGVQVTAPARSIVDAASSGSDPTQIQRAVVQAVERGLASPATLHAAARRPRYRYRRVIQPLVEGAILETDDGVSPVHRHKPDGRIRARRGLLESGSHRHDKRTAMGPKREGLATVVARTTTRDTNEPLLGRLLSQDDESDS